MENKVKLGQFYTKRSKYIIGNLLEDFLQVRYFFVVVFYILIDSLFSFLLLFCYTNIMIFFIMTKDFLNLLHLKFVFLNQLPSSF